MPKKTVEVSAYITDSYEVEIKARHFTLKIDQPKPVGRDTAPTPLEYFLFGLAGCFCTIARQIAQQRKINLRSVDAKIVAEINTDFLLCKTDEGSAGFTSFKILVKINADLSHEEKITFANEVEKRCPVADNILRQSNIILEVQ